MIIIQLNVTRNIILLYIVLRIDIEYIGATVVNSEHVKTTSDIESDSPPREIYNLSDRRRNFAGLTAHAVSRMFRRLLLGALPTTTRLPPWFATIIYPV